MRADSSRLVSYRGHTHTGAISNDLTGADLEQKQTDGSIIRGHVSLTREYVSFTFFLSLRAPILLCTLRACLSLYLSLFEPLFVCLHMASNRMGSIANRENKRERVRMEKTFAYVTFKCNVSLSLSLSHYAQSFGLLSISSMILS